MGSDEAKETDTFMGGETKTGKDCQYGHPKKSGHADNSLQFGLVMLVAEIAFIVLFGIFVRYGTDEGEGFDGQDHELSRLYPWFQDTHVMIVVGFGFLMTFLKRYGWSSVGFNFLITGFTIQWAILVTGLFHDYIMHEAPEGHENATRFIQMNLDRMLEADFTTGAILISFGAVLGVASPVQLIFMILFEVIFYNLNAYILVHFLDAADIGGSMVIHAFGAYFGLSVARVIYKDDGQMDNASEGTEYHSDIFSMIGTVFLWMFWPSFNSAPGMPTDSGRYYAVVNTYLSLCAACVSTFIFSTIFNPKRRVTMEHVQNATLAGGVAMGTAANMGVQPYGALIIGFISGLLSTAGYEYIKPFLAEKISLHDTCGVNNLHGMPAILAAVVSIVVTAINGVEKDGCEASEIENCFLYDADDTGAAWLRQVYALVCTLGIAIVSGSLVGAILRIPIIEHLNSYEYFEDGKYWEIEEEEDHED